MTYAREARVDSDAGRLPARGAIEPRRGIALLNHGLGVDTDELGARVASLLRLDGLVLAEPDLWADRYWNVDALVAGESAPSFPQAGLPAGP